MKQTIFFLSVIIAGVFLLGGCDSKYESVVAVRDGVKLTDGSAVSFQLGGISPNPFQNFGVVEFMTYSQQHIRFSIYNEEWKEVRALYDEVYNPGMFQLTINAENLPNGVFYLVAKGESETQIVSFVQTR